MLHLSFLSDTAGDSGAPLVPEVFPGLCQHKEGSIKLCPARGGSAHTIWLPSWFGLNVICPLTNTDCHLHGPETSLRSEGCSLPPDIKTQSLDLPPSAGTQNMPPIPTSIWRSDPTSFHDVSQMDTPPSTVREEDGFLWFFLKIVTKKGVHHFLILEDNLQPKWT